MSRLKRLKICISSWNKMSAKIPMTGVKDGALIDMFRAGKWDESTVKSQLAALAKLKSRPAITA